MSGYQSANVYYIISGSRKHGPVLPGANLEGQRTKLGAGMKPTIVCSNLL
jgi:hypothetical protein